MPDFVENADDQPADPMRTLLVLTTILGSVLATGIFAQENRRPGSLIEQFSSITDAQFACMDNSEGGGCPKKTGYELYADCRDLEPDGTVSFDCGHSLTSMNWLVGQGRV